jgi:hypothetical protein
MSEKRRELFSGRPLVRADKKHYNGDNFYGRRTI